MSVMREQTTRLSLSAKWSRLSGRMRNPEWRRYGKLLLAGKGIGIGLVMLVVAFRSGLLGTRVLAAERGVKAADIVNPVNTVWTRVAAFLVFGMQAALNQLEGGLFRTG